MVQKEEWAKLQPSYTWQRESGVWAVIKWTAVAPGVHRGEKIETYDLQESARRRVYDLNGWEWKG